MDIGKFKSSLKASDFSGIYVFAGEEDYLIRYYMKALREAISTEEAFAVFNNPVFDGPEVDFETLAEAVKAPPMMADFKIIEWRHADFTAMKETDLESLEELCDVVAEYPYSIVAFSAIEDGLDFGTPKKPSAFIKRFDNRLNILRFEKSTETQLYAWLKRHFDSYGINVNMDTLRALVFRSGKSMDTLANEVEKLAMLAKARGKDFVTPDDVNEVASSTPECDTFALSNSILERNKQKAYDAIEEMKIRRVDPLVIMGMMAKTFDELTSVAYLLAEGKGAPEIHEILKINEYRIKLYISAAKRYGTEKLSEILATLANADAGSKYGGVTGYCAVELFISRTL